MTERTRTVTVLMSMVEQMSVIGAAEVERALTVELTPVRVPAEARVAELGALAEVLESDEAEKYPFHLFAPVQVSPDVYDARRPLDSPSAATLTARYGHWHWACRAAWGLLPDGRKREPGKAWTNRARGMAQPAAYSRDECIATIRQCAFAVLRRPTSNVLDPWVRGRRARARQVGGERPRLATTRSIYRFFDTYRAALAAANITDEELAEARLRKLRPGYEPEPPVAAFGDSPAERLADLDSDELDALGLTERRRDKLVNRGCGELQFSEAAALAAYLGGSIAWLAGVDVELGQPAVGDERFDGQQFNVARKEAGVREQAVCAALQVRQHEFRRIARGARDPSLAQAVRLAGMLTGGVSEAVHRLTSSRPDLDTGAQGGPAGVQALASDLIGPEQRTP